MMYVLRNSCQKSMLAMEAICQRQPSVLLRSYFSVSARQKKVGTFDNLGQSSLQKVAAFHNSVAANPFNWFMIR